MISTLLKTSRPGTWIVPPLVFLGGFLTYGGSFTWTSILQLILLSFPFCLFLFGINDLHDKDSDRINPRKNKCHLIQGQVLKDKNDFLITLSVSITGVMLVLSSILTKNRHNMIAMAVLLFFSYFYSAPPLRFKELPPLDSIIHAIAFIATFGLGYSFIGPLSDIKLTIYLAGGCFAAVHALTTILDYTADKKAKQTTFATLYGKRTAAAFATIVFIITFIYGNIISKAINGYLILCALLSTILIIKSTEKVMFVLLRLFFAGFLLTCVLFFFGNLIYMPLV